MCENETRIIPLTTLLILKIARSDPSHFVTERLHTQNSLVTTYLSPEKWRT
jgi:hypothetical protein